MTLNIRNIKSYVINLDKNIEKYDNIKNNFLKYDIYPSRFKAIYAKELDKKYINKITYPSVQYTIENGRNTDSGIGSIGAIGCSLSHIELWKMLVESNEDMFFILEDDAYPNFEYLVDDINNYINKVNSLKSDWDIIYIGWHKIYGYSNNDKVIYTNPNETIYEIKSFVYFTHAYIINKKGALKLLEKVFPIVDQIDSYISFMCMYRNVNAYRGNKYIIQKNTTGTDIQTDYSIKKFINRHSNNVIIISIISIIILLLILILIIIRLYKKLSKNNY